MSPPDSPRVALVHDWLTGMRGGESVLEELCRMFPGAPIFTLFHLPGTVSETIESHPVHTSFLQSAPRLETAYRNYLPIFPLAIRGFDLAGFDLVVSSSHCVAKSVVPHRGARHLCYCHTPMRYAWDQRAVYFRDRGPIAWARAAVLAGLRRWDAATAERVDLFVANSTFVAGRIRRYYGRDSVVVPPPVDVEYFTPGDGPRRSDAGYVLMTGAGVPYKRLDLALAAVAGTGRELRILGLDERSPQARGAPAEARFLGRVDRQELRHLYRNALCLIQPGVEDFGIAPVEALACGCPVVALGHGGVVDIVESGSHGLLYEPENDPSALAAAIDRIPKMQFNTLNLRERALTFSRPGFNTRMRELLEQLLIPQESRS